MAKLKDKFKENAEGQFFVDTTCIDCDACRRFSPEIFGDSGEYAFVKKQPQTEKEELSAQRSLLACPVGSIGMTERKDLSPARNSFPLKIAGSIYINGFNHRDSFGADSYFILSSLGNWLVDSPRFTPHLKKKFKEMGGIKYIFLTHQDDVGDAHLYARHFNAKRIIHQSDSNAQKETEIILKGESIYELDKAKIIFTPGHTSGHLVLLWDNKYLFTGDHFAWLRSLNQFGSFRDACWHSWKVQIGSVEKLRVYKDVSWVLPGHGGRRPIADKNFPEIIDQAVVWMKSA